MARNIQGKPGNKGHTAPPPRQVEIDEVRAMREFYWDEWRRLCAAVKKNGRRYTDRFDQPKDNPEVMMRDRAGKQFESLTKTLKEMGGLDVEEHSADLVVLDMERTG